MGATAWLEAGRAGWCSGRADSPRAPGMRLRTAGSTWDAMTALASSTESVMVVRVAVTIWAVARTPIVKSLLHAPHYLSRLHLLNPTASAGQVRPWP